MTTFGEIYKSDKLTTQSPVAFGEWRWTNINNVYHYECERVKGQETKNYYRLYIIIGCNMYDVMIDDVTI